MGNKVTINAYTTYFTLKARYDEYIQEANVDLQKLLNILKIPIFNNQGKYVGCTKYYRYLGGEFHLPIKFLLYTLNYLKDHDVIPEVVHVEPNKTERLNPPIKMRPGWQDREEHTEAFRHLTTYQGSMVGNNLQTGKGKSYVGVKLTTIFDCPTLVVCDGLTEQWVDNYLEKTDVNPDRIYVLQGINSLKKLWDKINKGETLPQILIVSLKTLTRYSRYKDENYKAFPRINELMKALKIGYTIFDEVHLNTHAIVMLLLVLNIIKNVFLSATPERSVKTEQKIFEIIFPDGLIGGASSYDRYVDTTIRGYELDLHLPPAKFETYGYGYSHTKYESMVLTRGPFVDRFQDVVEHAIRMDYLSRRVKGKSRCLIFVSTVRMADELGARFSKIFPDIDIRTYTASDPFENLSEAEIIISTPKSCGVGKDIKGLTTVINTVSMSSNPGLKQMFGRLRKLQDGLDCKFVDLINTSIGQQTRHYWSKMKVFKSCSKTFHVENMNIEKGKRNNGSNNNYGKFGYRRRT